ncbi:hypothetical protein J3F84DRAFT_378053 [Trichoderma pleuroticola]
MPSDVDRILNMVNPYSAVRLGFPEELDFPNTLEAETDGQATQDVSDELESNEPDRQAERDGSGSDHASDDKNPPKTRY